MGNDNFAEQIRNTAEAQQKAVQKALAEERKAAEDLSNERVKHRVESNRICHKVLLPAMELFAKGLEAAKVFTPQCWKVRCDENDDCCCWAHVRKTDLSGEAMGVVVKTMMTVALADGKPPQIQVQVTCYQASPRDWKEIEPLVSPEPSEGVGEAFVHDLYGLNTLNLDIWHKRRLDDCAKACANWLEQQPGEALR